MKVVVAGRDRAAEWGGALATEAKARAADPRCAFLDWRVHACSLGDACDERDYHARFLGLLRYKSGLDTRWTDIPRKPGLAGAIMARVRAFLWKLLRYQHDRMAFRQNLINAQLVSGLEYQRDALAAELERVQARLDVLEKAGGKS